jgi:tetratricopeptide (TPR) repeat protein
VKRVGSAVARSAITLLKDPGKSGAKVASLNAEDLVQILERIPPSSNNDEWVFVQPGGQPANRGYVRLGDLDRVDTGDHHFDLLCALASIMKSMDYADVKSRLESLQLAEAEADEIYLGLAQAYVHLAELTVADKNVARTALNKAKEYLKRAEALHSTEAAQNLGRSIQLLDNRLGPTETQQPDPGKLLVSAKAAYEKGMMLEAASDFNNALKQYSQAKGLCEQIKNLRVSNPDAEALRENASEAMVRVFNASR